MSTRERVPRHRQAANTPQAAQQRYTEYLQRSLACITKALWRCSEPIRSSGDQAVLTFPKEEAITLKTEAGRRVQFFAAQRFVIVPDSRFKDEYKTRTREYVYHLFEDKAEAPVIQWHWHPLRQPPHAHIHAAFAPGVEALGRSSEKLHIPSGRVAFEDVIRFLIEEVRVIPKRDDWQAVLADALEAFVEYRTWSGSAPLPEPPGDQPEMDEVARPKRSRKAR